MKNTRDLEIEIARLEGIVQGKQEVIDFLKEIIARMPTYSTGGITTSPWVTVTSTNPLNDIYSTKTTFTNNKNTFTGPVGSTLLTSNFSTTSDCPGITIGDKYWVN